MSAAMGGITGALGGASSIGSATNSPLGAIGGAVLGGITGAIGGAGAAAAQKKYEAAMANYLQQLKAIDLPKYEELMLALERYEKGEELAPELMTILQETQNNVSKITEDKINKETQLEAIAALKARAQGGLTLQDRADLLEAQQQIDRQSQGQQKSIMQNMAARGMGGSGQELASRLMAGQQGAQLASQTGLNVAAQSRAEALRAMKDAAGMSEAYTQNQFGRDLTRAQSQDDMLRRNLDRQQQSMMYNVNAVNAAKAANLARAQSVSDRNVDMSNFEQKYNKDLKVDDYDRQIKRAQMIGGMEQEKAQRGVDAAGAKQAGLSEFTNQLGGAFSGLKGVFGGGGQTPGINPNTTSAMNYDPTKYGNIG
jgi:exonuclease VII small subunit